jgi:hypothetical protein
MRLLHRFPLALLAAHDFAWLSVAFATRGLKEFGEPARKAIIIGHAPSVTRARTIGGYHLIRDLIETGGAFIGAGLWKIGPAVNVGNTAAFGAEDNFLFVHISPARRDRIRITTHGRRLRYGRRDSLRRVWTWKNAGDLQTYATCLEA